MMLSIDVVPVPMDEAITIYTHVHDEVEFKLLNTQVDVILRALELYYYNLEYIVSDEHLNSEERERKKTMLRYTYEIVHSSQAEQVNGKVHSADTLNGLGKSIIDSNNVLDFIPKAQNA